MTRFSVIIPLYNKAPYVRKAMESVLNQTYLSWELIIVDDGSTDGSDKIVKNFFDTRIRFIQQKNSGVGTTRNNGVLLSTAPYITFLDADDWWEPTFLEEMTGLIKRHPDAGIYGTGYYIVKNNRKRLAPIGIEEGFSEGNINYCQVYAKTLCMPLWTGAVCIPRVVFNNFGGFKPHLKLGEDFDLWVRIAQKQKVVFLNKPLSNYNQDVDVTYRGTHHLRAPKEHMLWNLGYLETEEKTNPDYKQLIDNLRTYDLLPYMLTRQYRSAARQELAKVDWSHQPSNTRRLYQKPILYLKLRMQFLKLGSKLKQSIIKHV